MSEVGLYEGLSGNPFESCMSSNLSRKATSSVESVAYERTLPTNVRTCEDLVVIISFPCGV